MIYFESFSPFLPGTPAYFLAGPFMGDGGAFSDMLHVAPADGSTLAFPR